MRGIRYNPRTQRVVLPVFNKGELQLTLARRIFDHDPDDRKYRQSSAVPVPCHSEPFGEGSTVVLVEDYVSAVKLSRYAAAFPLLGTSLKVYQLAAIANRGYTRAVVWLDDDNRIVRRRQRDTRERLSLFVPDVKLIRGIGKDPKECSGSTISEVLSA